MCAAVDIEGPGTVEPAGVTFPGAYKKDDPGLIFKLYPKDIQTSEKRGYVSSLCVDIEDLLSSLFHCEES
jgi:hypothetical protein